MAAPRDIVHPADRLDVGSPRSPAARRVRSSSRRLARLDGALARLRVAAGLHPSGFDTIGPVQAIRPGAPFEVYCDRCRVTFPLGTRRCIHCGGPTGSSPRRLPSPFGAASGAEEIEAELDPTLARRRLLSPLTLVWIVLIVGGYLIRACSGQTP
jgi:hypothetical protein